MPIGSFSGLQTSLRGLLAQQRALDVTGHNITNSGTEGFSRQQAVLGAAAAQRIAAGATQNGGGADIGAGVDVLSYQRIRDQYLDVQFRGQETVLGDRAGTTKSLERAELSLAEPGDNGIAKQLATFWNGWADLANAPENVAARQALIDAGKNLAASVQSLDAQLQVVADDAQAEHDALIAPGGEIDARAQEIARLNKAIVSATETGVTPNDLLDRRDLLLDQLSEYGRVTVEPGTDPGDVQVTFGGELLVPPRGWTAIEAGSWTVPSSYTSPGGRLGALQRVVDTTVPQYRADLEAFATKLRDDVNGAYGATPPASPFFGSGTPPARVASTLDVAPGLTAQGLVTGTTGPGDNSRALAAAALRGGAPDALYSQLVTRVGGDVRNARREEANAKVLVDAVEDRRQSVAGVSMDEEMTNLVRFQRGYQASARALSTMDEILDVLINRTGRVGL